MGILTKLLNWFNGNVIFEAELDGETESIRLRLLVELAYKSNVNLSRANLYGANLYGASLYGASLYGADLSGANLSRANLSRASLYGADLSGANLSGADLYGASLYGADLSGADLSGANLSRANLSGANLFGAKGVDKHRFTPLLMLLDQPGPIRAYKLVTDKNTGPHYPYITYEIGSSYEVSDACTDDTEHCAPGISLATLDWCMSGWREGYRILIAEFSAQDIAAIPTATDGKFRVFRCKIVGEKDLKEIGLIS